MKYKKQAAAIIYLLFSSNLIAGIADDKITKNALIKYSDYKKLNTFPYPFISIDRNINPKTKWNVKDNLITTLIEKSKIPLLSIQIIKLENNVINIVAFWANGSYVNSEIPESNLLQENLYKKILPTCNLEFEDCL